MLQTLITALIGVSALAYLLKRWWPAWQGLWRAGQGAEPSSHCASTGDATLVGAPKAGCAQGCGQCSQGKVAPLKDHRVHLVRQVPH